MPASQLSKEEVQKYRTIHRVPSLASQEKSNDSLEESEVDFFRRIHKLPAPENKNNPGTISKLSEDEVEFFRRVHKLPTDHQQPSDRLTPQEVQKFREIHQTTSPPKTNTQA